MRRFIYTLLLATLAVITANAQRKTDPLDRGLVAISTSNGVFVSWRQQADEYYDVTYNLYRNGTKINSEPLTVTNFTDASGSTANTYAVAAVVKGVEQEKCTAKTVWANDYLEINPQHSSEIHSTLVPNDACAADVDGDGQVEILMKYDNVEEINNAMQKNGWYNEHTIFEVLELDGTVKWWVNCGPNMGDFQNNEQNIVGYDWDQDGKAEVIMRLEEGSTIHMANGNTYQIGADGQNGTSWTNYREPRWLSSSATTVGLAFNLPSNATVSLADNYTTTAYANKKIEETLVNESPSSWLTTSIVDGVLYVTTTANTSQGDGSHTTGRITTVTVNDGTNTKVYTVSQLEQNTRSVEWFTHYGKEFLVYCNGETGEIYDIIDFPCARYETGETDLYTAWGDGYGHRSSKYFFGAPYLDGRNPSIFVGRGIYTRHKFVALDVDKNTHKLSERWRWMNNSNGPWKGQGYHNYAIVDVDWDGRDEIVWGSMVIDDNGMGLSTTGLGHGDAQHHGDLNPYIHGQEGWFANEDNPNNNYRDLTTSKIYYRNVSGSDDGRAIAGNFSNEIYGAIASSAHDAATPISLVTNEHVEGYSVAGMNQNFRCYWDGDLCEETFNYVNGKNSEGSIAKFGSWTPIKTLTGSMTNNDTKGTPCFMGDILGDWREEFIMRTADNKIRVYTTTIETPWRNYSLWYDHQYRNGMVWEMCGYNQPPHVSYFLGELEEITVAPPALTMTGRTEIADNGTISTTDNTLITCETNNMTINVTDGASPYIYIDNAPSWVQGSAPSEATSMQYDITYKYYTHTLTGGAFSGAMRLVKQGDGTLKLPDVTQTYTGNTDVWAGAIAFNGTMQNSPLWMNRHSELYTTGTFAQPVTMEYGSKLYISENISDNGKSPEVPDYKKATFNTLNLHEGARVVFDVNKTKDQYDNLTVTNLNLRKQNWVNGPEYSAPVFEINNAYAKISVGTYPLCTAENIEGDINDITIESATGFASNTVRTLENVDGTIYLNVSYENELFIGSKFNISSAWTEFSPSYTIEAGNSCAFKFTNYGGKDRTNNWILTAANGEGHSTADSPDYAEYFALLADGTALQSDHQTEATNVTVSTDITDWKTFVSDMSEAEVEMTVSYSSTKEVSVSAVFTAISGQKYNYTAQYSGCNDDAITLFFTVDHSHMTYPDIEYTKIAPQVKMTYVDYNNPSTAYGEVTVANSGYNNASGSVGFAEIGWGCNWITYLQVDLSAYKGKDVNNVTLTFDGSGSTDSKRGTIWGVGYNSSTWSSEMTYNTADRTITLLGETKSGTTSNATVFNSYTFDITDAMLNDDDGILTILIYETAAAGGYVKNPSASISYRTDNGAVSNDPTNVVNGYTELYKQDFETASTIDEHWGTSVAGRYHSEQLTLEDNSHYAKYNVGSDNGATFTFSALPNVGTEYTTADGYALDFDFAVIPTDGGSSSGAQTAEFRILDTSNAELCSWKVTTQAHTAAANSTGTFSLNLTETDTFTANLQPYWYHVKIEGSADGTYMTVTDKENGTSENYTINEDMVYVGNLIYNTAKQYGGLCLDNIILNKVETADLTLSATVQPSYEAGIYNTVTVDRNFKVGYSSLCLPFNISIDEFTNGDDEAYVAYLSEVKETSSGTKLIFVNGNSIEANRPCIIYLSKALDAPSFSNIAVHKAEAGTITAGTWTMTGNYTPGFSMYGKYGVANNAAIRKGGSNSTLNGLSAYIEGPANSAGAKLVFGAIEDDDTPTGVNTVSGSTAQKDGKYADKNAIIIKHNGKKYRVSGIDAE